LTPEYIWVRPGGAMPELGPEPYRALLVAKTEAECGWRARFTHHPVATGCMYFLAWGDDCSVWHDCVDAANLAAHDFGDIPDDALVMTTWHQNEPLEEAMWFSHHCASHPDVELQRFHILHLGEQGDPERVLSLYDTAINAPLDERGNAPWDRV
jgi:hypothetical protein